MEVSFVGTELVTTTYVAPELRADNNLQAFIALVLDFIEEDLVTMPAVVLASPQDAFPVTCGYDDGEPPEYSDVEILYRGDSTAAVIAAIEDRHRAGRCVCVWFRCLNPRNLVLKSQLQLREFFAATVECTVALHLPRRPVNLPLTDSSTDHRPKALTEVQQYFQVNGRFAPYAHDIKGTEIVRILGRRWAGRLRYGTSVD